MKIRPLPNICSDRRGGGTLKLTFGLCLLAVAGAASSPAFETNPLISGTIVKFRNHLPETLQKVTDAMGEH